MGLDVDDLDADLKIKNKNMFVRSGCFLPYLILLKIEYFKILKYFSNKYLLFRLGPVLDGVELVVSGVGL